MKGFYTRRRLTRVVARGVGAALLVLTVGCAPGVGTTETTAPAGPRASVKIDPASMGNITLTIWDQEVRGGQNDEITELNAQFQAKYPNIKLDRHAQSFDDLQKTGRLVLTGPDAPDVIEANNSRSQMGADDRVLLCGAGARRGGGVSGIPGRSAAMALLEATSRP